MTVQMHVVDSVALLSGLDAQIAPDTVHLVDLRDVLLTGTDAGILVDLHARWCERQARVHYVASRPITRGSCVVAAHSAGDGICQVATNVEGAKSAIESGLGRIAPGLKHFVGDRIEPRFGSPAAGHRWISTPMDWMGRLQNGYSVPFIANVLSTFGFAGLTTLFPLLAEAEAEVNRRYGPLHGRIVTSFSTLGNGCTFCLYGHLFAANLVYFEASGRVGPIDESATEALGQMTDAELGPFVEARLAATDWAPALPTVRRVLALRAGEAPQDDEDVFLHEVLLAWSLINECSLQAPFSEAPPFDPRLARNRRLQRDYREARAGVAYPA
jgi:hypothetical protein